MQIVRDSNLHQLIDDPDTRPKIRELMKEFSDQSQSQKVRTEEPGIRIEVMGQILDEDDYIARVSKNTESCLLPKKIIWERHLLIASLF